MKRHFRPGFTLIELLVVITIMGMLMAIAFPAFQSVQETARKGNCNANLSGLAKGMLALHDQLNGFPGLVEAGPKTTATPNGVKVTWATQLLSQVSQVPMYKTWMEPRLPAGTSPYMVSRVSAFTCPSDPPESGEEQPLSYVVNAGSIEDGRVAPNHKKLNYFNGICFNRYWNGKQDAAIKLPPRISVKTHLAAEGAGFVLLMAENVQAWNWADKRTTGGTPLPYDDRANNAVEAQQYTGFVREGYRLNQGDGTRKLHDEKIAPDPRWARPSSMHPEGAHLMFCSGTVRYVTEKLDELVYQRAMTHNVSKSTLPKTNPEAAKYVLRDEDF